MPRASTYKKYRIASNRLQGYDYGSNGAYFVTLVTQNRKHFFGTIPPVTDEDIDLMNYTLQPNLQHMVKLSHIGEVAHQFWLDIPKHFPFVLLDEFIVMPDHMHGIIVFKKPAGPEHPAISNGEDAQQEHAPYKNKFGPQSKNLASVLRGFKAGVKKYATLNNLTFAWQPNYHDNIIRNDAEMMNIRKYIYDNPAKWHNKEHKDEYALP